MFNHLKKKVGSHVGSSSTSSSSKGKGKGKAAMVMEENQVNDLKKVLTLKTLDGFIFEVEEGVMLQSDAIKHMIEEGCARDDIPLHNVTGDVLDMVIEYCKNHYNKMPSDEEAVKKWDAEFINVDDQQTLYDLIMAADYLSVKGLLDLAVQKVADMIKGKMPEEIRMIFNITNDFTPEEEAAIRSENIWAFE